MIRLFNVYYPTRTLALFLCEALLIWFSFLLAVVILLGSSSYMVLAYEKGFFKISAITGLTLLLSYYFDCYAPQRIANRWEMYFRLLLVLGSLSFLLAGVIWAFPQVYLGHEVLLCGVAILTVLLIVWRWASERIFAMPLFRERVYVMGNGPRARAIVATLQSRPDAGMDVVGWNPEQDENNADRTRLELARLSPQGKGLDRVVVAINERRGTMPIPEMLNLRLRGVVIEDSTTIIERLEGRLPLDGLMPSSLIFSEGFRVKATQQIPRRIVSFLVALVALILCLPAMPLIMLAIRLSSRGPVFFSQTRVGLNGRLIKVYKFRTMCQDAEANGAVWAQRNDPRVTPLGRVMRKTRLDEIPQLWNVLRGDMGFVGPRPERPEFVEWLSKEIPYYQLRHMIRPGLTGWAQVRYQYGATLEETRNKLEFDLFYIKYCSLKLDLLVMFETLKTIVLRRGAQ